MLEEKIHNDYIAALKNKDKHKSSFLSFIRADLKNKAIDLKKEKLDDEEVLLVLQKQKKRLEDTKESIERSGRTELLEEVNREFSILSEYLPKALSESELIAIIDEVITSTNASSMKDMGAVMKEVRTRVGARAEAKKVSELVKQKLTS
jgi:uncharacterized protein YqeY